MWLVVLGVVLLGLKVAGIGPVAGLSWWLVLAPFAAAAAWWHFADATGITQRKAMERDDQRAARRRQAQFEALGLRAPPDGKSAVRKPSPDDADPPGGRAGR
jgi:small Trp-rich protein